MTNRFGKAMLVASLLTMGSLWAQPATDLVDSIFRPANAPGLDTPVPLQPAIPMVRRQPAPRVPRFELTSADRVLLLGDSFLEREAEYGYLETRLSSEFPGQAPVFRNLSWQTNTPLGRPSSVADDTNWLADLRREASRVKPTVVLLGYGTDASAAGEPGLARFRHNCALLRDALGSRDTSAPVRFVWFSPIFLDGADASSPELNRRNTNLMDYAMALFELATNRQDRFAPGIEYLRISAMLAAQRNQTSSVHLPRHTDDRAGLTPYGFSRVVLAMERTLSWPASNWRFGLQPDGTLRAGGFGATVQVRRRTDDGASVTVLEERLPAPNPAGFVDLAANTKPQCYIQVPALKPGPYTLRVDGQPVVTGSESDWGRYMIISDGPSWAQAEELRQAIVAKNRAVTERWRSSSATAPNASPGGASDPFSDPRIAEWEAKIRKLAQPVRRTYEFARPGGPPQPAPPAAPAAGAGASADPAKPRPSRVSAPPPPPPPVPPKRD